MMPDTSASLSFGLKVYARLTSAEVPYDLSKPFRLTFVKSPNSGTRAAYLELSDHHDLCDSIVHSNIIEIGQAVKYALVE